MEKNIINKISDEMKEKIKKKSILTAPNNPTEKGMSPTTIKKLLTDPVVADKESIITEINRIVDEINLYVKFSDSAATDYEEFTKLLNEIKTSVNTNANDITNLKSSLSSLQSTVNSFSNKINTNANDIQIIYGMIDTLQTRIKALEDQQSSGGNVDLSNYYNKQETSDLVDAEVKNLEQEIGNYYLKKPKQEELVADGQILLINTDETVSASTPTIAELAFQSDVDAIKNAYIKSVSYNIQTGIFTFTKQDGTIFEVDLAIEKVVANFVYNSETQSLELTLADGTVQSIPLVDFISAYEGVENDYIQVVVQSGNKIQAILKDGSITLDKLHNDVKETINNNATQVPLLQNQINSANSRIDVVDGRVANLENKFDADLTGSIWNITKAFPEDSVDAEFNLNFTSNGKSFVKIGYNKNDYVGLVYTESDGTKETAYFNDDDTWSNTNYQTIAITGGADVKNQNAIGWLKTISQLDSGGTNIDSDLPSQISALGAKIDSIASRVTSLEQNQGSGGSTSSVSAFITESVVVSEFSALETSQGAYTHSATVTLTNSLDTMTSIELVNNNPVLFSTYGFAIASASGTSVVVYSIGKPSEDVTLTFEMHETIEVWDGSYTEGASASLITFTIDGTSYQSEEGMTWSEWCSSEYNTGTFYTSDNSYVYTANPSTVIVANGSNWFNGSTVIIADTAYTTVDTND